MGKNAQRKRQHRAATKPRTIDDRHDDFGTAGAIDPETIIAMVATSKDAQGDSRVDHRWVMGVLFEITDDDEACRLAALRESQSGVLEWAPADDQEVVHVEGPYCAACMKIRGPVAVKTWCGKKRPSWLVDFDADKELDELPRHERRATETRLRHERRKLQRALNRSLGTPPGAEVTPPRPRGWDCPPEPVEFTNPPTAAPEPALFRMA